MLFSEPSEFSMPRRRVVKFLVFSLDLSYQIRPAPSAGQGLTYLARPPFSYARAFLLTYILTPFTLSWPIFLFVSACLPVENAKWMGSNW